MDTYRWTLDEYLLRCEDGIGLTEVVTEADLDRDVIGQAIDHWGYQDAAVIDVDEVVVPEEVLDELGLDSGIRANCLAIAILLEERAQQSGVGARVAVVVDRDYDPPAECSRYLVVTDGYSMENYMLDEGVFDRFMNIGIGRGTGTGGRRRRSETRMCSGQQLLDRVLPPATEMAAVRLALRGLDPPLAPFARWDRHVRPDSEGNVELDGADLLARVLNQSGRSAEQDVAEQSRTAGVEQVLADPMRLIRGHDWVAILLKLLKSNWGRRLGGNRFSSWSEDQLARILTLALRIEEIVQMPMFRRLQAAIA